MFVPLGIGRLESIGLPTAMVGGSLVYDRSIIIA